MQELKKPMIKQNITLEWQNAEIVKPEPFFSLLLYIPSQAPLPTVVFGYATDNGNYAIPTLFDYDNKNVKYWCYMPEWSDNNG